ncbi:hypothetical protein KQX54_008060 [Cotesia glomerata]|uniref:EGF-like domain-containing protein n=1 Tax=Cotesia glomerata TaxID=32391 RepID=A0AAV7I3J0_COTGL|nr:hypothetical protein KQX54_008060 [Cotesia glomerata]
MYEGRQTDKSIRGKNVKKGPQKNDKTFERSRKCSESRDYLRTHHKSSPIKIYGDVHYKLARRVPCGGDPAIRHAAGILWGSSTLGGSCKSAYDCDKISFSKCSENNKCVCEAGFIAFDSLTCLSPQLSGSCTSDNDCNYTMHAKCADNNKCECRANNVAVNGRCLPVVNGFCWKNETCATKNSICIDSTCQCNPGFKFSPQINECLQPYIGKPCEVNSNCDEIVNGECSNDKRCTCKRNSIILNEFTCGPKLGGACSDDEECLTENSECEDNLCVCKTGFFAVNTFDCRLVPTKLGMPCNSKANCKHLYNSDCIRGQCACPSNTLAFDQTMCLSMIGGNCLSHNDCIPAYSVCNSSHCACQLQYVPASSNQCVLKSSAVDCRSNADCGDEMRRECSTDNKCVCKSNSIALGTYELLLGDSCKSSLDCHNVQHAICTIRNNCECRSNFVAVNTLKCMSPLNEFCLNDSDCLIYNYTCKNSQCKCKFDFQPSLTNACEPKKLFKFCRKDDECNSIVHAKYSIDNECVCRPNNIAVNDSTCLPKMNAFCWKNEPCAIKNSFCINNVFPLEKYCEADFECRDKEHRECSRDNKCIFKPNHISVNESTCLPVLNGFCITDDDCQHRNSYCSNHHCQLSYRQHLAKGIVLYIWNIALFSKRCCSEEHYCISLGWGSYLRELRCVKPGETCVSPFDCHKVNFATCSKNKTCECVENFVADGNSKCLSPVNDDCMNDDDCLGDLSCINSQCKCQINFQLTFDNQCKQNVLKLFCQSDRDCDEVRHAKCSSSNKCVCRPRNTLVNSTICMPMIGAFCWKDEPCAIDNSACINSTCQCKPEFKYFSENDVCLNEYVGMSCKDHQNCKSLRNTECSSFHKCVCLLTTKKVNATTCLSRLNSYCEHDEDCVDPHSTCIANKCQCRPNYITIDNDKCELITLGKKCKGDSDCQNLFSDECSADEICVCKLHHVAINESVCQPVLNGICFSSEDCQVKNSKCHFSYCQCKSGFVPFSQNLCLKEELLDSCGPDEGCESSGKKQCSKSGKCICTNKSLTQNPSIKFDCTPLIGGFCNDSSECEIDNSICIDNKCQCNPSSTFAADNLCIFMD